jgi:phage-related protein
MDLTINGTSLATLGVIVENRTNFVKPKRRHSVQMTEGVDGSSVEEYGYDSYSLSYKLTLTDSAKFDEITALIDGDVILEVADDPGKFFYAKVLEGVPYSPLAIWRQVTVEFYIYDPFRYVKDEADVTLTSFPTVINYNGSTVSFPLLKIMGTGLVTITLNGISFTYNFDTPYVYIECMPGPDRGSYYLGDLKNRRKTGGYPYLSPGNNNLTVSGALSEIVVSKRTRYL